MKVEEPKPKPTEGEASTPGSAVSKFGRFTGSLFSKAGEVTGDTISKAGDVAGGAVAKTGEVAVKAGEMTGTAIKEGGKATTAVVGKAGEATTSIVKETGKATGKVISKTGEITGTAVGKAGDMAGEALSKTGEVTGTVISETGKVTGKVIGKAGDVTGSVVDSAVGAPSKAWSFFGSKEEKVAKTVEKKVGEVVDQVAPPKKMPKYMKFVFGGSAGMLASGVVQPLDLLKNRMQLAGVGGSGQRMTSFSMAQKVISEEGFFALYNGLSAGLLRQATYTTTRLGVYQYLFEKFSKDNKNPNFLTKAFMGMTAGGIGSFIGTPAEISLIRMTSDGRLPPSERRNYSSVFNALYRISKEEGVLTLWRGCGPTVIRAMVVNAAQLASYSQAKQMVLSTGYFQENILLHFVASMISGLITTITSMPVDIAKTRIQSMKVINGKPEYSGALDVFIKIIRKEGFFSLWKGFTPYYARLGPHTVLTFIFLEQMNSLYKIHVLGDHSKGSSL